MLLLILSTQGRKWGFCTEIPVKSDWSELSVGILAAPVFVKAIRQGFFSFLCERFNEAADIHFSQSDFISFSSKAAQSKSYHQTFSPSHCNHCHWFVPTFCSLLPALPQTCNHQTVQILTRKKKIAQLKNTRENENSSYSVDLYTLCITLKMFKREPTSYFPVSGDTKIQTHVLASFCTKIAQLQDKKNFKQVWLQDQEPGKHEYQHCHQIFLCKSANLNASSFFVCMKTGRVAYS